MNVHTGGDATTRRYFLIFIKDNFDPGLNLNLPFIQLRKNNCKNLCKTALRLR